MDELSTNYTNYTNRWERKESCASQGPVFLSSGQFVRFV
jgi:hypothetical protein